MGYRSEVVLMAVFANAEEHDEVMSIYRMNPKVQEHKLEAAWRRVDMDSGVVVRIYEGDYVKWYESYEDVIALKGLEDVMQTFHDERGFSYAWGYARIGEEPDDSEYEARHQEDDGLLIEVVYDNLEIERRLALGI